MKLVIYLTNGDKINMEANEAALEAFDRELEAPSRILHLAGKPSIRLMKDHIVRYEVSD